MHSDISRTTGPLLLAGAAVLLALQFAGCGGGGAPQTVPDQPAEIDGGAAVEISQEIAVAADGAGQFTLRRVDALGRGSLAVDGLGLEVAPTTAPDGAGETGGTQLRIAGEGLSARHSLYLDLDYDAGRVHPSAVQLGDGLDGTAVILAITDEPGVVQIGIASIGAEPRLSGDVDLATVEFASGAFDATETARPSRTASSAPKVGVKDLAFHEVGEQTLTWTYNGNGDYDQNGEVTVGDITPVGLHFGATFGGFNWDTARVADGDHNGEVNASDITPIGLSFGSRTEEFDILVSTDEAGPFDQSVEDPVPFDAGDRGTPGGLREYQVRLQSPWPNYYYGVVASDGSEQSAANSNVLHYTPVNQPPTVALAAYPNKSEYFPGTELQFDASFFDLDGSVVSIEWDLDCDGQYESTDLADATQFQRFFEPGVYRPAFRATDNLGASERIKLDPPLVVSYGQAESAAADVGSDTAHWLSAENVDGKLGMAYINDNLGKLCYLNAAFVDGVLDSWDDEQVLATASNDTSLAIISGNPGISYFNNGLFFVRAIDPQASSFGTPALVSEGNPGDPTGLFSYLAYWDGLTSPYIVCTDSSGDPYGGDIWSNRAIDPEGTVWNGGYQAWLDGQVEGRAPSVVYTNSWPMLVYQVDNAGEGDIHMMRSADPFGDFYDMPRDVVIGEDAVLSADNSLLFYDGRLLVVYWSRTDRVLRCVQTSDEFLLEWGDPVDVATAPFNEGHYSLAMVGGTPAVAYFTGGPTPDTGYWGLKYTHAITDSANYWSIPQPMYADPDVRYPALADIDGRPVVAFQAGTDHRLRVGYFAPGS